MGTKCSQNLDVMSHSNLLSLISTILLFCLLFIHKLNTMKNTTAVLKSIVNLKIIVFCQNYQNLNVENQLQRDNLLSKWFLTKYRI